MRIDYRAQFPAGVQATEAPDSGTGVPCLPKGALDT